MSGKQIEFPKNKDVYLKKAVQEFQNAQLDDAILHLEKALQLDDDVFVYPLYITTLLENNEVDRAKDFLESKYPDIAHKPVLVEIDMLYIRVLSECYELTRAQEVLNHRRAYYQEVTEISYQWDVLEHEIIEKEKAIDQETAEIQKEVLMQIAQVEQLPFYKQQSLLAQLNIFTQDAYLEHAKTLLKSTLHPMLKTYLLEMLCERGYGEIVELQWHTQLKSVALSKLVSVLETPFYIQSMAYIQELRVLDSEKEVLRQNLLLYVSILYPFITEAMPDHVQFIHALQQRHKQRETEYQKDWFDWVEKMIAEATV